MTGGERCGPEGGGFEEEDAFLTVREVAGRLKISTATVYKLIDRGELPHVRVSNSIRVPVGR